MFWLGKRHPLEGSRPIAGLQTSAAQRGAATIILSSVLITTATMLSYPPERAPVNSQAGGSEARPQGGERETTGAASSLANPPMKVVGGVTDAGKPCEEQTWPYKDRQCLAAADDKRKSERAEAAKPLATDKPSDAPQSDQNGQQPAGSVTAIAPTPPVSTMTQSVGETTNSKTVPILPSEIAKQQAAAPVAPAAGPQASAPLAQTAQRPLSRREQRRVAREARRFERTARPAPPAARTTASTDGRASTRDADGEEIETIDLRRPHRKLGPLEPDDDAAPTASSEPRVLRGPAGASSRSPHRPRRVIVVD